MHRSLSLTMALLVAAAVAADAQSSASSDATVSASVSLAPLTMATTGATDFGTVSAADIVNQTGNSILNEAAPGGGQSAALFTATGEPYTSVLVTCAPSSDLTLSTDASQTIRFYGQVAGANSSAGQSTASVVCGGGGIGQIVLNELGSHYFWLGGTLSSTSGTMAPPAAGVYSGSYTLSVNY